MALRVGHDRQLGLFACCRYCSELILGTKVSSGRIIWTADTPVNNHWVSCPKHPTPDIPQPAHMPEEVDLNDPADVEKWLGES